MLERFRNWGITLVLILALGGIPTNIYMIERIPRTPLKPDPVAGFVYPLDNHGVVHYVTWFDNLVELYIHIGIIVFVPTLILLVVWAKFQK